MIGRKYADRIRKVISGSIGLDDWERVVDLFKQLICEMRFDMFAAMMTHVCCHATLFAAYVREVHHWKRMARGAQSVEEISSDPVLFRRDSPYTGPSA